MSHRPSSPATGLPAARKGYSRRDAIPPRLLLALSTGREEPRTLVEWLAIDVPRLLKSVLPEAGLAGLVKEAVAVARRTAPQGVMERHRAIGAFLHQAAEGPAGRVRVFESLAAHPSGMVREWAAMMLPADPSLSIAERIRRARRFAADPSTIVREIAWVSYRPYLAGNLDEALGLLAGWVRDPDPGVRRCAVESTRPRGVWCRHLAEMKEEPGRGLPLLEPVRADTSRYVQLSVGNWLNDASKTSPAWTRRVCRQWRRESPRPETEWIVRHALRTLSRIDGSRAGG
ncbi:MAG TPA: DNA alkylation repair protein [Candidatus Polarisedimenticolia bacterium]|nr:DNA alkylation repair protein [Candidatus Polarisedimenticolia bacterium]